MATNPEGQPTECVAQYRELGGETALPEGFHRVTSIEEFHAHVNTTRAALSSWQQLQEWKLTIAPARIKAEAQRRIFALTQYNVEDPLPGVIRQLNLTTNAVRILARKVLHDVTPSGAELDMVDAGIALVDQVNAIRAFSNQLEARAAAGEIFDVPSQAWPY